jgi:hypothetical protein
VVFFTYIYIYIRDEVFLRLDRRNFFNPIYKIVMCYLLCEKHMFFKKKNTRNYINNIK